MIISHEHKFIFLKTRKTAGTSLDIALSRFCGPRDVITPINSDGARTRGALGYSGPQNFYVPPMLWRPKDLGKVLIKRRRSIYTQHMPARDLRIRLPADIWNSYFKFCVERNPFDKAISLYFWRTRDMPTRPALLDFLKSVARHHLSNFDIYTIEGTTAVDCIVPYEDLHKQMRDIAKRIGLNGFSMPETLRQYRADRRHYREVIGPHERAYIEDMCGREIAMFNYSF